jgi:hypothetical protein
MLWIIFSQILMVMSGHNVTWLLGAIGMND